MRRKEKLPRNRKEAIKWLIKSMVQYLKKPIFTDIHHTKEDKINIRRDIKLTKEFYKRLEQTGKDFVVAPMVCSLSHKIPNLMIQVKCMDIEKFFRELKHIWSKVYTYRCYNDTIMCYFEA